MESLKVEMKLERIWFLLITQTVINAQITKRSQQKNYKCEKNIFARKINLL